MAARHQRRRATPDLRGAYVLAADTVVAVGRRILPKAELIEEAAACLRLLSGRAPSGLYRRSPRHAAAAPCASAWSRRGVRFKRLSSDEIEAYLASGEWRGKAGGYAIQGLAGAFVIKLVGSYTNVVGLPLYETLALLDGEGYPVRIRLAAARHERGRAGQRAEPTPAAALPDLRQAARAETYRPVLLQALRRRRSQPLARRRLRHPGASREDDEDARTRPTRPRDRRR